MKIGILTYHRAENYGALLQAYALREFLKNCGFDAEFVDYWPQYHIDHYTILSYKKIKRLNFRFKVNALVWAPFRYLRKYKLQKFMIKYLGLSREIKYKHDDDVAKGYDCVIYGSDQIWRKQNEISYTGFNPWYFGSSNIVAHRKISYAGSMGTVTENLEDQSELKEYFKNFNSISVREIDLQSLLYKLGFESELVSDPVFLLSIDEWRKLRKKEKSNTKKYILFYNLLNTEESVDFVKRLQYQTSLEVKEINMNFKFGNIGKRYVQTASIQEFIQLIDDAEYVVSNSFHGVAFSILFEKQFFVIGMRERASRVKSLLQILNMQDRFYEKNEKININSRLDYKEKQGLLKSYIDSSKEYLLKAINSD